MLKDILQADLKQAMLARDSLRVDVLRGLKSAILYAEVETGKREEGLSEDEIIAVLKKESKKRQESYDLYVQGGRPEQADKEMSEKQMIDAYLPKQLDELELSSMIDETIAHLGISTLEKQHMGQVIGAIKTKAGAQVDGALLAKLINGRIAS